MNLKTLTLGAAVVFAMSACKKESPVKPEATLSNKEVNACVGASPVLDGTIVNTTPKGSVYVERVTTDKFGNIFTVGYYDGKMDVNPGSGTFYLTGRGAFVQKTSAAGKFIGAMSMPISEKVAGVTYYTASTDIDTDNDGNVYVAVKDRAYGAKKVQIIKANNNGTILYRLKLDNTTIMSPDEFSSGLSASPVHIAVDKQGNLVVVSSYNTKLLSNIDLDPGAGVYNPTGSGGFILKLDPAGKTIYVKEIPGGQLIKDMQLDANNNIHIVTHTEFWGGTSFDNQYKYDALGNQVYKTETEEYSAIEADKSGGIYQYGRASNKFILKRFSPDDKLLWEANVDGGEFISVGEDNLYALANYNNVLRLSKYNGSVLAWRIPIIQLTNESYPTFTVDHQNNIIIISNTYPNKVRVLKYKPCN